MTGLFYTMGLNPSQFIGGLGRAQAALGQTKGAMGSLSGMAAKLTAALGAIGAGAAGFAAVKKGLTLAADFEKTEVGMNTIIKNLEVTRGLIGDLQALAAKTPLELPDITGGARTMLGAGWDLGTVVTDLKMFGDVAAGAQTDVGGLIQVIAQVKGKGRLMAEELLQFSERGVAGLRQALATIKGMDTGQLAKAMEKGQVSVEDLMNAFRRMTTEGGIFFKSMQHQSKTTYGLVSTLKDGINQIFLAFSRPTNNALKPLLESAIVAADNLAAKARETVGAWGVAFAAGKLGELLYDQLRVGLAKAGNYAVAVFNAAGLLDGKVWEAMANYLKLGLDAAAESFIARLIAGFREFNGMLPSAIRANDARLENAQHNAGQRGQAAGAAMTHQGMILADYFKNLKPGDLFKNAPKLFNETPGAVSRDAAAAARANANNAALAQKEAYEKAKAAGPGGIAGFMSAVAAGMKQAVKSAEKIADNMKKAAGEAGADAGGGPLGEAGGTPGRIRGFRFAGRTARASGLDYLRGRGLSGAAGDFLNRRGPSALDYLKGSGLTPGLGFQARATSRAGREQTEQQQLLKVLQQIAQNTANLKVV